jgi:hypothetical protein
LEKNPSFFNSLSIRIPLAIVGGIFYSILTYDIIILLNLPSELAMATSIIVFLFYLGSRFLILFSGIDTPYYFKGGKTGSKQSYENTSFYQTTQWVGKFYHYHDIVLFVFLTVTAIVFLITLITDGLGSKPIGSTIQNLLNSLTPLP